MILKHIRPGTYFTDLYRSFVDDWGTCSERYLYRHLKALKEAGAVVNREGYYWRTQDYSEAEWLRVACFKNLLTW